MIFQKSFDMKLHTLCSKYENDAKKKKLFYLIENRLYRGHFENQSIWT
jgi:hypothetical protein